MFKIKLSLIENRISHLLTYTNDLLLRGSRMEKVWCGARGKAMKGACTIFAQDGHSITFITLRKRNKQLIEDTLAIPNKEWKKIRLLIPKRKYCNLSVYENEITLKGCKKSFRGMVVKDHGRENPTYVSV